MKAKEMPPKQQRPIRATTRHCFHDDDDLASDSTVEDQRIAQNMDGEIARLREQLRLKDERIRRLEEQNQRLERDNVQLSAELALDEERLRLGAQVGQDNQRLQREAAEQLQHFASLIHEVRTPLNSILGLSNLILEEDQWSESSVKESMQIITSSGDLLRSVVDDVLDYSKLSAGHLVFDIQVNANLASLVASVVDAVSVQATKRSLQICTDLTGAPVCIATDGRRLQQVLYNLLGNAVKFGRHGGTIEVKAALTGKGTVLHLSVKDYGKGIPQDELELVFDPFYQARHDDSSSTNLEYQNDDTYLQSSGTGLGLSIASKLVHGLGGSIHVESEEGEWTEFIVELPYHPCSSLQEAPAAVVSASPDSSIEGDVAASFDHLRVLVAEDNTINQKVLHRALNRFGVKDITIVGNGQRAVEAAMRTTFDVIFMDISMPIMDGLQATRIIHDLIPNSPPQIIFLTAHADVAHRELTIKAGGDGFIAKPIELSKIKQVLQSLLLTARKPNGRRHRHHRSSSASSIHTVGPSSSPRSPSLSDQESETTPLGQKHLPPTRSRSTATTIRTDALRQEKLFPSFDDGC
jgi:signal transduction histidine kinase/DNA-binding response OmpR family regulator